MYNYQTHLKFKMLAHTTTSWLSYISPWLSYSFCFIAVSCYIRLQRYKKIRKPSLNDLHIIFEIPSQLSWKSELNPVTCPCLSASIPSVFCIYMQNKEAERAVISLKASLLFSQPWEYFLLGQPAKSLRLSSKKAIGCNFMQIGVHVYSCRQAYREFSWFLAIPP